jgi:hypothetical protein
MPTPQKKGVGSLTASIVILIFGFLVLVAGILVWTIHLDSGGDTQSGAVARIIFTAVFCGFGGIMILVSVGIIAAKYLKSLRARRVS